MQHRSSHTSLPVKLLPQSSLSPYEAGKQARLDGMIKRAPQYDDPADAREWARGYDEVQQRIEANAEWARKHAATVDQWGFV